MQDGWNISGRSQSMQRLKKGRFCVSLPTAWTESQKKPSVQAEEFIPPICPYMLQCYMYIVHATWMDGAGITEKILRLSIMSDDFP